MKATAIIFEILTILICGGMTMAQDTVQVSSQSMSSGVFSVLECGALPDGATDNTAAFQKAIDKAAEQGGIVHVPPGRFLIAGSLQLKPGVTLEGIHDAPQAIEPLIGSVILATSGRDNEAAPALFEMGAACIVRGLTVWYPDQKPEDIHPYPWTFHLTGFDNTVENVTLINSYNGISVGPEPNVRHRIRSVYGCVLRRGLFVDGCTDIGRVENVQFHCHWWSAASIGGKWDPVYKFMGDNLEAFVFGRTDWEYVTNNFVFPARIGYRFIETKNGACNGHLTGDGADSCQIAVQVDAIQPMGLLITGGQFVSFLGERPVELVVSPTNKGSVRLVNCAFWGPADHNAIIEGEGYVSFNDCYFSSWKEQQGERPLIIAKSGRLQIQNSTFATEQPAVELAPEVKHAIIRGNNGVKGVRILNHAKAAIIEDNEQPPATESQDTR